MIIRKTLKAPRTFRWVALSGVLLLVSACGSDSSAQHDEQSGPARREIPQYLIDHFPTRDQMIEVRECVTAQTGFKYEPLPENFGPEYILNPPEEMVRQASQEIPPAVDGAYVRCIFDLGYEDNFFPPEDHENLRNSDD